METMVSFIFLLIDRIAKGFKKTISLTIILKRSSFLSSNRQSILRLLMLPILFLVLLSNYSCNKYLDKSPDNSLIAPKTLSDLQGLLDDADIMNLKTPNFGTASSSDHFLTADIYNSLDQLDRNTYTWTPFDYTYSNDWSNCYDAINIANFCIEKIEGVEFTNQTAQAWNNVKGSALFYRAFYFTNLVWLYAKAFDESTSGSDLGIVLRLKSDFSLPSSRASVKESYEKILMDAKEAVNYLPDNPTHKLRPSKAATYGLLARVYLSMRQYDSCLKYSNLCLQINNQLLDYNTDIQPLDPIPFERFNKEVIFHSEVSLTFVAAATIIHYVDTALYVSYENNDIRKLAFFNDVSGYQQFKGAYTQQDLIQFSGIATDEIYLTRAECYARRNLSGDLGLALSDLNSLLSKRYDNSFLPVNANDATEALNRILLERRKELLFRELRWIDIKRLNKEGANIVQTRLIDGQTFTLLPNDNKYALPIPKDIIDLSGIPQN